MKAQHGRRWTDADLTKMVALWCDGRPVQEIADYFKATTFAINKIILRMRRDGIPVPRRKAGHTHGRSNKPWTQAEVEYLVRRRNDKATAEQIAAELDRSFHGVQGMILKLRQGGVPVQMLGHGVKKLWSFDALQTACMRGLADMEKTPEEQIVAHFESLEREKANNE